MSKLGWMSTAEMLALIGAVKLDDRDELASFAVFYDDFVNRGDESALLDAVYHCCISDSEPLHPWLKLAFSYAYNRGRNGEI